jgi:hypothetical protein
MSIVADFCPADLSNQPIGTDKELSIDEVNALLFEAEECDRFMRQIPKTRGFQKWNTYKVNPLNLSIPLIVNHEVIYPTGNGSNPDQEKENSQLDQPYTYYGLNPLDREASEYARIEAQGFTHAIEDEAECLTILGCISNIVYHGAETFGALVWEKNEEGDRRLIGFNREKAMLLIKTPFRLVTALSHTIDYVKKEWAKAGAWFGRVSVSRAIALLKDGGYLDYDSSHEPGKWAQSRQYTNVDVPRLLLLMEALQRRLENIYKLPEHGMATLRKLHEAIFPGWGVGIKGDPDDRAPEDYETSDFYREKRAAIAPSPEAWGVKEFTAMVEAWRLKRSELGDDDPIVVTMKKAWQRVREGLRIWGLGE